MKRVVMSGIVLAVFAAAMGGALACTIGIASGTCTADDRPLLWKVRDWYQTDQNNHVWFFNHLAYPEDGYIHDFIGIKPYDNSEIRMGMNSQGLVTGNALVSGTGNSKFMMNALGWFATVQEVRDYLTLQLPQFGSTTFTAESNFPFIDATGDCAMFETYPTAPYGQPKLYVYNCENPSRELQDMLGWVVRDNTFHLNSNGMDDLLGGHYGVARTNMDGMIDLGMLSVETVTQGITIPSVYELLRNDQITSSGSRSAIAVQGVLPGEHPALTTMWALLGQPRFSIATPTWAPVSSLPAPLVGTAPDYLDLISNDANWLRDHAAETTVQASVFPAEAHLFAEVDELMNRWRFDHVDAMGQMTRVEGVMATDAHSVLHCLRHTDTNNMAPTVTIQITERKRPGTGLIGDPSNTKKSDHTFQFQAIASDSDGTVDSYAWNFGDGGQAGGSTAVHTYTKPGWYLVSCTVQDDTDVTTTDWQYLLSGSLCGGFQGLLCPQGDYCKMADDTCSWADLFGVCTPIPGSCNPGGTQVCGCDGITYENECFAEMAMVSIAHDGPCDPGGGE